MEPDFAHVTPSDLTPDTVGRGNAAEGNVTANAQLGAVVERYVSKGYARSNLLVLKGGAGGGNVKAMAAAGNALQAMQEVTEAAAVAIDAEAMLQEFDARAEKIREARMKGYEGDACGECGNFTLVRNGTCLKCNTCGSTSGCS